MGYNLEPDLFRAGVPGNKYCLNNIYVHHMCFVYFEQFVD
jgi:hypothetical protein